MPDDLERARALRARFEQAKAATEPIPPKDRAEEPKEEPERTTSAAKSIAPHSLAADRAAADFQRAASGEDKPERSQGGKTQTSQGHAPRPQQHLQPRGSVARAVNARQFSKDQAKEHKDAQVLNEALERKKKLQERLDIDRDQHDIDRDGRDR